jgi:hypothetical protein
VWSVEEGRDQLVVREVAPRSATGPRGGSGPIPSTRSERQLPRSLIETRRTRSSELVGPAAGDVEVPVHVGLAQAEVREKHPQRSAAGARAMWPRRNAAVRVDPPTVTCAPSTTRTVACPSAVEQRQKGSSRRPRSKSPELRPPPHPRDVSRRRARAVCRPRPRHVQGAVGRHGGRSRDGPVGMYPALCSTRDLDRSLTLPAARAGGACCPGRDRLRGRFRSRLFCPAFCAPTRFGLVRECDALAPSGHFRRSRYPYIDAPDFAARGPPSHAGRTALTAVAYDRPSRAARAPLRAGSAGFVRVLLGRERLFRYADPLGALNLAVMSEG